MKNLLLTLIPISVVFMLTACSTEPGQTPTPDIIPAEIGQVIIEDVEIQQIAGTDPVYQAVVRGQLTNTCTRITTSEYDLNGDTFTIDIRTALLEDVTCKVQHIDFQRIIPLSLEGLGAGEYTLNAGTLTETFDLQGQTTTADADQEPTALDQPGSGSLTGVVWHDECINDPSDTGDHAGCLESGGVFIADGSIGSEEAGIPGVRIDLGQGECPATGLARVSSASDGSFEFANLESGTYCLSVNPAIPENQTPLGDGIWTAPEGSGGSVSVELVEDEVSKVMLGWDPLNLPEFITGEAPEPDCIARAAYYGDVTIPDNTVLEPGEQFTKTWRIRNEGTCTWGPGYEIVFGNGDQMGGMPTPLPAAAPGEIVLVSVDLTAPEESGYYRGNWGFRDPHGNRFSVGASGTTPIFLKIVVSFYSGSAPAPAQATPSCGEELNSEYIDELLERVNAERARRNLPPLRQQEQLSAAAQSHSSDMACNDFLTHTGTGDTTYRDRVLAQGYTAFSYLTENIYAGNPSYGGTPEGAVEWWMNSKVHRDAILHPTVTEIGIGYAFYQGSTYGAYYTLLFTEPTS